MQIRTLVLVYVAVEIGVIECGKGGVGGRSSSSGSGGGGNTRSGKSTAGQHDADNTFDGVEAGTDSQGKTNFVKFNNKLINLGLYCTLKIKAKQKWLSQ